MTELSQNLVSTCVIAQSHLVKEDDLIISDDEKISVIKDTNKEHNINTRQSSLVDRSTFSPTNDSNLVMIAEDFLDTSSSSSSSSDDLIVVGIQAAGPHQLGQSGPVVSCGVDALIPSLRRRPPISALPPSSSSSSHHHHHRRRKNRKQTASPRFDLPHHRHHQGTHAKPPENTLAGDYRSSSQPHSPTVTSLANADATSATFGEPHASLTSSAVSLRHTLANPHRGENPTKLAVPSSSTFTQNSEYHLPAKSSSATTSCSRQRIAVDLAKETRDDDSDSTIKRKTDSLMDYSCVSPAIKKLCFFDNSHERNSLYPSVPAHATPRKSQVARSSPPPGLSKWLKTFQEWDDSEKTKAVDQLIETCELQHVRHMMSIIEPQFQRDFISLLPKELALYVLSFLDPLTLTRAARTCRYWSDLATDRLLWREKCLEAGIRAQVVYGETAKGANKNYDSVKPCYKQMFQRQRNIENNWNFKTLPVPLQLKGHDDHVITCLEFSGDTIISGSDDSTLKVWSASTGKCLRTLHGHTGGVWSSQMTGNTIVSGSTDRTLKVWNAKTGKCIYTLVGHTSTVRCMHLFGDKVISGSRDASLRVWDVVKGRCLSVLQGHVAAVRCVQYHGGRAVSGAYDYTVKIWDIGQAKCLHTLTGHTNRVYSLQFDGIHIVSGSLDTSIRVWRADTGVCLHTLVGHQSLTSGMELRDDILVSGNADSTIKVWDIRTGRCLQTLQGVHKHQSAVTCLQFNKSFVITSSDDGTIKIWSLKTGEFLRNLVVLESGSNGGVVWRIRCDNTRLVCAVGSRNGTEETKLLVMDFDPETVGALTSDPVDCGEQQMRSAAVKCVYEGDFIDVSEEEVGVVEMGVVAGGGVYANVRVGGSGGEGEGERQGEVEGESEGERQNEADDTEDLGLLEDGGYHGILAGPLNLQGGAQVLVPAAAAGGEGAAGRGAEGPEAVLEQPLEPLADMPISP